MMQTKEQLMQMALMLASVTSVLLFIPLLVLFLTLIFCCFTFKQFEAMARTRKADVKLNQMEDITLQIVFKYLSATNKVALERVNSRFRGLIFKNCTDLDLKYIDLRHWRGLISRFRKLIKRRISRTNEFPQLTQFIPDLATLAPHLEVIDSHFGFIWLYLKHRFNNDPNYDGSHFKSLIRPLGTHRKFMSYYPQCKVGCEWVIDCNLNVEDAERGTSHELVRRIEWRVANNEVINQSLNLAPHVTVAVFKIEFLPKSYKLESIFNAMTNLNAIKRFELTVHAVARDETIHPPSGPSFLPPVSPDVSSWYKWTAEDANGFERLLRIRTLKHVHINVNSENRLQLLMVVFTSCPRTDFKSVSLRFNHAIGQPFLDTRMSRIDCFNYLENIPVMNFVQRFTSKYRRFNFVARDEEFKNQFKDEIRQFKQSHPLYKFVANVCVAPLSEDIYLDKYRHLVSRSNPIDFDDDQNE